MKKTIFVAVVLVIVVGLVVFLNQGSTTEENETAVSNYIKENISELSPASEVLGGTFYVTNITFNDENGGTVEYEDGHIALVADFEYTISRDGTVEVTLSNPRDPQPF